MENVAHIEDFDIDENGSIKNYVNNGKPIVLMGKGGYCGHCETASPAFEQFAEKTLGKIVCATIVTDGEESEKKAGKFLSIWDKSHRGVPTYMGFGVDGKFKKVHDGGRDIKSLEEFGNSLM
jgi:thiol-disulfide isomerase/thioredoxin